MAIASVVALAVLTGFVFTRSLGRRDSAESAVAGYLSDLKNGNCSGAISKLTRAAEEQIRVAYSDPKELCRRLQESRRIPTSFKVASLVPQDSGEQTEVTVEVSYPDGSVTETYYALREGGAWRVQPPWA